MIRAIWLTILALAAPTAAGAFLLNPPIDCDLGTTCHIQQYVDRDPGPGAADFTCGPLTYDGHKGTDFALPSLAMMQSGVDVLAAAPGTVVATRDGMPDIASDAPGAPDLNGKECGNGVLIRHGGGWETQYCHMKNGSVIVEKGQRVAKGSVLGEVGLSGQTEFPHVHLSVRHNGAVIDPFAPTPGPVTCNGAPEKTLWQHDIPYEPGALLSVGVTTAVPAYSAIKAGLPTPDTLPRSAPALVVWGYAFGGRAGDEMQITLTGPQGEIVHQTAPVARAQAQFFRAAGKRGKGAWPVGEYTGKVVFLRGGVALDARSVTFRIAQ